MLGAGPTAALFEFDKITGFDRYRHPAHAYNENPAIAVALDGWLTVGYGRVNTRRAFFYAFWPL
jgi:hypothetical protein